MLGAWLVRLVLLVFLAGCNLDGLRNWLKGESLQEYAELILTVEPASNISIFIDGEPVATASPYHAEQMRPGSYQVLITATGYHAVQLPLSLAAGQRAQLPVQLRPIKKTPPRKSAAKSVPQAVEKPAELESAGQASLEVAQQRPRRMRRPVQLRIAVEPPGPVFLDAKLAGQGSTIELNLFMARGELDIGASAGPRRLSFAYEIDAAGQLFLHVRGELDKLYRNGTPLGGGPRRFFLGGRPQRYDIRVDGQVQRGAVFRRIEQ